VFLQEHCGKLGASGEALIDRTGQSSRHFPQCGVP